HSRRRAADAAHALRGQRRAGSGARGLLRVPRAARLRGQEGFAAGVPGSQRCAALMASSSTAHAGGRGGWAREAAAGLFFLGLGAIATRPLALRLGVRTLAGGDPMVDLWTVSWIVSHFFDGQAFGGNMFHPAAHAVLFSDPSLGTAVLLLPLRPL